MLEEILGHINNYFVVETKEGGYEISNGTISLPFLIENQYFRIVGSIFNDGVYKYPTTGLVDESFTGSVQAMAVPPSVIALATEISEYNSTYQYSSKTSESFGGYSYTNGTNPQTGMAAGWQDVFRSQLNKWRKL